jgi:predicted permease
MRIRLNLARLHDLLARSPLSQNHWAIRIGISRGHWSDLVNGKHPYPSPRTRARLLEVFEVPAEELFIAEAGPASGSDTDFRAGLRDRYLIDRELGQGAMGSVYLARDVARGRTVAVKVLAPEAVCGVGQVAFLREIATISRLQHPHIVPLFDSGVVAEHPFFVMPWIRGGSLRDRLRRETRLPLPAIVALVRGVADALAHAHAEFVLHCDVKPENILLHGAHAWLMDFGISRVIHAEASEWRAERGLDVSAGTPAYVSPEQALGADHLDGRVDVYSLACVTYELLTGRPPFEGTTTEAVVARRFVAPPPPIADYAPETPAAVVTAVARAMELDPARRTATPGGLAEELARASHRAPGVAARVSLATSRGVAALRRRAGRPGANRIGGRLVQLVQDSRLALRRLRRDWRFALAFVLPLALGLGAGATFYSIVDTVLYRQPPGVADPDGLIRLAITTDNFPDPFAVGNVSVAWVDYEALRRQGTTLQGLAGFISFTQSVGRGEDARRAPVALVTASYFPLLGVRPALGRFFGEQEDAVTSPRTPCVAGHRFWRTALGGSDAALGREVVVGRHTCTIVGVTPRGFNGLGISPVDLWLPLRAAGESFVGNEALWNTDGSHWMRLLARARPGVSLEQVGFDATRAYRSFTDRRRDREMRETMKADGAFRSVSTAGSQRIKVARWLVGGSLALLLLIGSNLVNLLIARNLGQLRETAIRLALGGGRGRLFLHSALECGLLAALAAGGALLTLALLGPPVRAVLYPGTEWASSPVTGRVAALAGLLAFLAGALIAGITSLYTGRVDPAALLTSGGGGRTTASRGANRARLGLVAVQAALSLALLVASAGFVRSFRSAAGSWLGYEIEPVVFADAPSLDAVLPAQEQRRVFFTELHQRLRTLPEVASASLGYNTPWYFNRNEPLRIPGRDSLPRVPDFGDPVFDAVTPDYFATMGLSLRAGRWLAESDGAGAAPVMVVTESLAELYWGDARSAIGKCIQVGAPVACREVVGVVGDLRFQGPLDSPHIPLYFLPLAQATEYAGPPKLFVRARGDPDALVPVIRRIVQTALPGLPAADVHRLRNHVEPLLASWRLGALSFSALGVLAALIATLGLFSVMAFLVAERRREFAIRSALGARQGQIVTPVLRQGMVVAGFGLAAGLLVAWRAAPWLEPQLFHVRLLDPRVIGVIVAGLLLVAWAATLGPARRAARSDPNEVLRAE